METPKLQQRQTLVIGDVITGFSFSFSKGLLAKLDSLVVEDKMYTNGMEAATNPNATNDDCELTSIAHSVILHLAEQLQHSTDGCSRNTSWDRINNLMETAREFLRVFENAPIESLVNETGLGQEIVLLLDQMKMGQETKTAVQIINLIKNKFVLTPR